MDMYQNCYFFANKSKIEITEQLVEPDMPPKKAARILQDAADVSNTNDDQQGTAGDKTPESTDALNDESNIAEDNSDPAT